VNAQLRQIFARLQNDTNSLLKQVMSVSSATYYHKPSQTKWSVAEILTHLLTSEKMSLRYLQKKSLGVAAEKNTGFTENARFVLLMISQYLPLRYRAPKKLLENTPLPLPYGELVRQWDLTREELRVFLEQLDEAHLQKRIFRHPRVGMLNIGQTLRFMRAHVHHHQPQIEDILVTKKRTKPDSWL
jgi:uncharacterized damage-inducible protein DinB